MGAIDQGKVRYDEMYYLQGLYERFSVYDRQNVPELVDTDSKLVTEGPVLLFDPETGSSKLRYLILLAHMVICAKEKKNVLSFEWKVDLYKCIIRYEESGGKFPIHLALAGCDHCDRGRRRLSVHHYHRAEETRGRRDRCLDFRGESYSLTTRWELLWLIELARWFTSFTRSVTPSLTSTIGRITSLTPKLASSI